MSSLPKCPKCDSEYTYEDRNLYVCPECAHEWSKDAVETVEEKLVVRDAYGNLLQDGDAVTVIKDLKIKGSSSVVKVGTKVKNIRLVEGDHNIDCKIDGIGAMQLKSEFVKKAYVKSHRSKIEVFTTKDGSIIRELMHPSAHGNQNQSLAEAVVPVGTTTQLHGHGISEEIYHVTAGEGLMTLGLEVLAVQSGDSVCIPPGTPHKIANTGTDDLRILCCCAPAYSHDDTELLD